MYQMSSALASLTSSAPKPEPGVQVKVGVVPLDTESSTSVVQVVRDGPVESCPPEQAAMAATTIAARGAPRRTIRIDGLSGEGGTIRRRASARRRAIRTPRE